MVAYACDACYRPLARTTPSNRTENRHRPNVTKMMVNMCPSLSAMMSITTISDDSDAMTANAFRILYLILGFHVYIYTSEATEFVQTSSSHNVYSIASLKVHKTIVSSHAN